MNGNGKGKEKIEYGGPFKKNNISTNFNDLHMKIKKIRYMYSVFESFEDNAA